MFLLRLISEEKKHSSVSQALSRVQWTHSLTHTYCKQAFAVTEWYLAYAIKTVFLGNLADERFYR